MLYAGQIGALMSLVFRGGKAYIATLLLIFIWLAWDAYSLYVEPVIYAYSPFIGFFSGAIYDDVIVLDLTYGVYRLYNLLQLSLLWAIALALWDEERSSLNLTKLGTPRWRTWVPVAVALSSVVALGQMGDAIGFSPSRAGNARALGGEIRSERVVLHYDSEKIEIAEAQRILEDHHFHLERLDEILGEVYRPIVRSFVYSSVEQKRALMGARRVEVAKPWLGEVHLTRPTYGASVVRHELAHVVLGRDAPWPLNTSTMAAFPPCSAG